MADFIANITELPANIVLQPGGDYRLLIFKDRIHVATYTIGKEPELVWEINKRNLRLDNYESSESVKVISQFSTIFIQHIDGKLTGDEAKFEIKKLIGYIRS